MEEWKVAQARLYMMLWADPVIRSVHLDVPTGKKWVVTDTVGEAEGKLKHKIVEAIQQDRRGLGGRKGTWWSKKNERGRHDLDLRSMEEGRQVSVAVGQPPQGAWTTWEAVQNR